MALPSPDDVQADIRRKIMRGTIGTDGSTLEIPSIYKAGKSQTLELPSVYPPTSSATLEIPGGVYRGGNMQQLVRSQGAGDFSGGIPSTGMGRGGDLVNAIIQTESGGRNVRGKAGEYGPMQVTPALARRFGVPEDQLNDPQVSMQVGQQYLSHLMQKYNGDLGSVLAAYNAGEGAVDKGRIPASTQQYVQKVLANMGNAVSTVLGEGTAQASEFPPQAPMPMRQSQLNLPQQATIQREPTPSQPFLFNQTQPNAPGWMNAIGQEGMRRLHEGEQILTAPYRGAEAVARPMYRTALTGTPFAPGDIPPGILRRLPPSVQYALTRQTPGGQPTNWIQRLQDSVQRGEIKAADAAAAISPALLYSKVGPEQMLGMRQFPGGVINTMRGRKPPWAGAGVAEATEELEPYLTPQQQERLDQILKGRAETGQPSPRDFSADVQRRIAQRQAIRDRVNQIAGQTTGQVAFPDTSIPPADTHFENVIRELNRFRKVGDFNWLLQGLGMGGKRAYDESQQPMAQPSAAPSPTAWQTFKSAWQPGAAEAAMPSPEQIKGDIARRGSGMPSVDEVKNDIQRRQTNLPDTGYGVPGYDPSKDPWLLKGTSYLPAIGQMTGQYGADVVGAPFAVGAGVIGGPALGPAAAIGTEAAFSGAGAAGGQGIGDVINRSVRSFMGYPNRPTSEILPDMETAGIWGAASVPGAKLLGAGLGAIAPAAFKAARFAKGGFEGAQSALKDLYEVLERTVGMSRQQAERIAENPTGRRQIGQVILSARDTALKGMNQLYQKALGQFGGRYTVPSPAFPQALEREFQEYPRPLKELYNEFNDKYVQWIKRGKQVIPNFSQYTGNAAQELRMMIREKIRGMNPYENRDLIAALRRLEANLSQDMNRTIGPKGAAAMRELDARYGDIMAQYRRLHGALNLPSAPAAARKVITGEASQVKQLMDDIGRMAPQEARQRLLQLRSGITSFVYDAIKEIPDQLGKLKALSKSIGEIPEGMFQKLYGTSRDEMRNLVDKTIEQHGRFLQDPDLAAAVRREMQKLPRPWLDYAEKRLAMWEPVISLIGFMTGHLSFRHLLEYVVAGPAVAGFMEVTSRALNSAPAREAYLKLMTSKVPAEIARALMALAATVGTEVTINQRRSNQQQQQEQQQPQATPTGE